jgi:hypothetical protein
MICPVRMSALAGATGWLNAEPPAAADLCRHVVLINFWTLTCINWLRQAPYVRAWSRAYRRDGLAVLGIHTPEFSFEHDAECVRRATTQRAIDYPVAIDNEYAIWTAFDNRYWPALYFVDRHGVIRDQHFGEGRYEQSEHTIQRLLGIERDLVGVEATGVEAQADWSQLGTPETYLGYGRIERFASPEEPAFERSAAYRIPRQLHSNQWAMDGHWTIGRENVRLERAGGSIACRFQARDANLVLSMPLSEPIAFHVLLDGSAPGPAHGVDVEVDGAGVLRESRLYQLVRQSDQVGEHTVQIVFHDPGAEAYAFTFG